MRIERSSDVTIVGLGRLAFYCKHRDAPVLNKRSRDVVLGRKGIGGNQERLCATSLQRTGEISRFCSDVCTGNELHTIQWFLFSKAFSDQSQNRHLAFSPFNALLALA